MDRNIGASYGRTAKMVALRKESVDRNLSCQNHQIPVKGVALRKESVDRNMLMRRTQTAIDRRSPQGERG